MADAQVSGTCDGNIVWVQLPSSAPNIFSREKLFGKIVNKKFVKSNLDKDRLINVKWKLFGFMVARVCIKKDRLLDMKSCVNAK